MTTHDDTQEQLNDLEEEEQRIIRELHDLEERARADEHAKQRHEQAVRDDPEGAFLTLLLECEKEVRDAKGYISSHGPPLTIVRVRSGETAPKGATYLSRPKNTGVDFTVPLTTRDYTSVIKRPMFLNTIRDKIRAHSYSSSEDYLEDMRLLARNTAAFNKGLELSWVVQHARLLLEAAEDAVTTRRKQLYAVEDALRNANVNKQRSVPATPSSGGKRKRSSQTPATVETANGDAKIPSVGQSIDVYWPNYRRWFTASVVGKSGTNVHVVYDEDNTDQWIDLQSNMKWRVRNARAAAASTKSRRSQEQPASKRKKGSASTPTAAVDNAVPPVHMPSGPTTGEFEGLRTELLEKLDEMKMNITDQLREHLARVDRLLLRSDHLERVLLAVDDSRESVEAFMGRIESRQSRIEDKLEKFVRQSGIMSTKQVADVGPDKGPQHENEVLVGEAVGTEQGDVEVRDKQEAQETIIPNKVIVVDDSSTDRQDSTTGGAGGGDSEAPKKPTGHTERAETAKVPEEKSRASDEDEEMRDVEDKGAEERSSPAADAAASPRPMDGESKAREEAPQKAVGQVPDRDDAVDMDVSSPGRSDAKGEHSKAAESETRVETENTGQEKDGGEPRNSQGEEVEVAKELENTAVRNGAGKSVIKQEKDATLSRKGAVDDEESSDESDGSDDSDSDSSSSGDEAMKGEKKGDEEKEDDDKPSSKSVVRNDKSREEKEKKDVGVAKVCDGSDAKDAEKASEGEKEVEADGEKKSTDKEEEDKSIKA